MKDSYWWASGAVSGGYAFGRVYDPLLIPFGAFIGFVAIGWSLRSYKRADNSGNSDHAESTDINGEHITDNE